ncbi:unnamed protein product [Lymnaea stagnalis]|uniref:G-protein coupled receptors family 1 profile domain-containing protein n=1 Tax=Lymnaea stagnalis TaxID=6523 RepID=A0AAV2INY2_LYMST
MLRNFEFVMTYILLPTISVFGVVGNVMSMLVLLKHGLHKCSNILIFALAVADLLYLVGTNNIALQIYTSGPSLGFFYPERVAEFLFVMYHFEIAMESVGKVVSLILPSCITFERLLAVFFPLHFSRILTPLRIWVTVGVLYVFGVSAYVQYQLRFRLVYEVDPSTNRSVGMIADSEIISQHAQYYVIFRQAYIFIYGPFPVGFSLVGCLLIGFKIRFHEKKRKTLMNVKNTFSASGSSMKRTTRTLLTVCIVYTIIGLFNFVALVYIKYCDCVQVNTSMVVELIRKLGLSVNSSCNFIIYVGLNRNFRDTYREIFCRCARR